MSLFDKILEAKEIIGDKAAIEIAKYYKIENFNENELKGCCPFHHEKTPSFIWNKKDKYYKCFGCSKRVGILDMYIETEGTYKKAVKRLFKEANIEYDLKDLNLGSEDYFRNYIYPKEETNTNREKVDSYCLKRGISKETLNYAGIKEDVHGNVVFELRNIDDELLAVKYRLSRGVKKSEPKMWWQKNASNCPLLYNISKIDITKPIVITEGYFDCLSIIEAGYTNVVSIPGGAEDLNWIEFNYDFLQNFEQIILWFDNDTAGKSGLDKTVQRIGESKCKIVKPTKEDEDSVESYYVSLNVNKKIRKTDANNILLACGKNRVIYLIENAEEIPLSNIVDLTLVEPFDIEKVGYTPTGLKELDKTIYGYVDGSLNVWTAYSGVGKALTLSQQLMGENGYFKMGDVKVGDKVYGDDGELHNVAGVYPQGKLDVWKVTFNDGSSVKCSKDHLWTVKIAGKIYTLTLEEIINNRKYCKRDIFIPMCKPLNFPEKELIISPFMLGLIINDDNYTQEYPNNILNLSLEALGLKDCNSCDKFIPDIYKFSSIEDRIDLIKGIVFSNNDIDSNKYEFTTSSFRLIKDIQFVVNSLGGTFKYKKDKNNSYKSYIRLSTSAYRKIMLIEYVGKEECQCISVDSPNKLYLTNNCIVTHNTTLISQSCIVEAINRGQSCFWFNAELSMQQMWNWVLSQSAGRDHVIEFTNDNGFKYYKPTYESITAIKEFYRNKIFVYDNLLLSNPKDILNKMQDVYRRRGTKIFVLDNWMCLNFRGVSDADVTGMQVDFMNELVHFAKRTQSQIHVVAHPRKPSVGQPLNEYDILGTSNIVNIADRIFGLEQVFDNELKAKGFDRQLTVFKDRILGEKGFRIGLNYDKATRRLYGENDDKNRKYNWDDGTIKYPSDKFGENGLLVGDRVLYFDKPTTDYNDVPF